MRARHYLIAFAAWAAADLALLTCTAAALAACDSSTAAGPSREETAVIGSWAGQVDAQGVPLLLTMDIAAAKSYLVEMRAAGDLVERERGTWFLRAGRLHTVPATCDQAETAGGPLRPITCTGADSILVNITGDTWTLHFPAGGELVTFQLKRL